MPNVLTTDNEENNVPEFDEDGNIINDVSLEDQQARTNLIATIIGGIANSAGLDSNAAVTAATIETENNQNAEPFVDEWLKEQTRKYSFEGIVEALANGLDPQRLIDSLNENFDPEEFIDFLEGLPEQAKEKSIANFNIALRATSRVAIMAALADERTTPAARAVLQSFLTGAGPREFIYDNSTQRGREVISELLNEGPNDFFRSYLINAIELLAAEGNGVIRETSLSSIDDRNPGEVINVLASNELFPVSIR